MEDHEDIEDTIKRNLAKMTKKERKEFDVRVDNVLKKTEDFISKIKNNPDIK
jgi:hypothetical protein